MHSLIETLMAQAPVLTDGAWGTQLDLLGLPGDACGDEWNLSHPGQVEQVARSYVEAGSQVVLTNTFRANRLALQARQLSERVRDINRAGVEISRRAAAGRAGLRFPGPQRQTARHPGGQRGRAARGFCRAGPGPGRGGRRCPGHRDHERSARSQGRPGGGQGNRPAGGGLHGLRER